MDLIFKYNKLSIDSIPVSKNQLDKLFLNKNIESVDTAIEINLNDLQPIYEE